MFYFFLIVWWKKNFKSNCFIICFKPFLFFWQLGKFISFQPYWLIKGSIFGIDCVKNVLIRSYSGRHFSGIFPHLVWIRCISPYSVQMRENAGKMRTRITPNTDSFYAVILCRSISVFSWFSATVTAYLKHMFSVWSFGFIVAFLFFSHVRESIYDLPQFKLVLLHLWCSPLT